MDNEVFRHSYELVNIDKIKSEMEKMLELDPYQHIRAWHLLHLMGLMSASMRFENVKAGWNIGYINSAIDSGLTCAYILNHLAAEDMDKSEYFHKNRLNTRKAFSSLSTHGAKHYSEEELKFEVDMAIAMDYVAFERSLAEMKTSK
jgi:hypothetical protein